MGFLSALFGNSKKDKIYTVDGIGTFYYEGIHFEIHRWNGKISEASISVIGDSEKPFDQQIELVRNIKNTLNKFNNEILNNLNTISTDTKFNFKNWEENFILIAADLDDYYSKNLWCFTLEEKNENASQYYFELKENKIISCTAYD